MGLEGDVLILAQKLDRGRAVVPFQGTVSPCEGFANEFFHVTLKFLENRGHLM
jgi:hypothetical protein